MKYLVIAILLAACGDTPTKTGAVCEMPDPEVLGYAPVDDPACVGENCTFGKMFMDTYCISCHLSTLPRSQRHGAPLYHDFDTLLGVLKTPDHIDEQAGIGPNASNHFMPPSRCPSVPGGDLDIDCPQPTDAEREMLSNWIACERDRDHNF